jgi:hypothetical protein
VRKAGGLERARRGSRDVWRREQQQRGGCIHSCAERDERGRRRLDEVGRREELRGRGLFKCFQLRNKNKKCDHLREWGLACQCRGTAKAPRGTRCAPQRCTQGNRMYRAVRYWAVSVFCH